MNLKRYKEDFESAFSKTEPIIKETLSQLLQGDLKLASDIRERQNISDNIASQEFPKVLLMFKSGQGDQSTYNVFFLDEAFTRQFYAWMIGDEPAEQLTDEHFDGLKESVEQIFGQIKMNAADDQARYLIDEIQVGLVEDSKELESISSSNLQGIECIFTLEKEGVSHKFSYLRWPVNQNSEKASTEMEQQKHSKQAIDETDTVDVQPAEFDMLNGHDRLNGSPRNVDMLMDVDLDVAVELDRKTILVSDLLKLGKGSIVELEKSAGEPLDVFVNGRKFAEGEVVVIDDKFGIRITQLLSPKDRVKSLG